MRFHALVAAAVTSPLLILSAAYGGSEGGKDDPKAPGVGSTADATGGASGSGSVRNGEVADSTKGYKLVAPESVDAYTKSSPGTTPGAKEAKDLGVDNAQTVSGVYNASGTDPAKVGGTRLTFYGYYGEIADPAKALDAYLATAADKGLKGSGKTPGIDIKPSGNATTMKPAGLEGALMKCQDMQVTRSKVDGAPNDGADFRFAVCAWSDYSTLGGADVVGLAQMKTGGNGASRDEVAALTVKLYDTARQKA